jgi:hypothetical protein
MTNIKGKKVSEQTASTKKEEALFSLNSKKVGQLDITPSTGGKFTFYVFVKILEGMTRPIEINLELNPCLAEMVNIKAPSILKPNIKITLANVTEEEMMVKVKVLTFDPFTTNNAEACPLTYALSMNAKDVKKYDLLESPVLNK